MTTLTDKDSILEQLANGNKLTSYRRVITIDLTTNTKEETYQATVDKLIMPNQDADDELARAWLDKYTPDYTTISIKGRGGMLATLPYSQKTCCQRYLEFLIIKS